MPRSRNKVAAAATKIPQRHHLDCHVPEIVGRTPGQSDDDLLSTHDVARWLGVSEVWLEIGRSHGYGPPFVKLSPRRVRYRRDAVLRFLDERTYRRTSEYADRAEA
jgi:predicted DNA-binding transcriptional regulator AlpA